MVCGSLHGGLVAMILVASHWEEEGGKEAIGCDGGIDHEIIILGERELFSSVEGNWGLCWNIT